jgi:outer membrane murein-binding lipoprotein Lpp
VQELDGLRQQAQIWCGSRQGEGDKLKAEVELLNGQLLQRSNDLSSLREQLTEARSERDRALQERQQVGV